MIDRYIINVKSNHPPSIIRQLPAALNRRLNDISCNKEAFDKAKTCYEEALQASGYTDKLSYSSPSTPRNKQSRNRKRKVILYKPPFNKSVQTNIGKQFLNLIQKHFWEKNKFHQIFNKNNVKVSYDCNQKMASIIRNHNNKVLNNDPDNTQNNTCNCGKKEQCPLENNCLSSSIIYNAHISTDENTQGKNYIGLTEGIRYRRGFRS